MGLIQFGELIRVGNSWRLTQVPLPIEGESMQVTEGGILMQPVAGNSTLPTNSTVGLSKQMQGLLDELQKLDQNSPTPGQRWPRQFPNTTQSVLSLSKS